MPQGFRKDGTKLGFQKGNKNPTYGKHRSEKTKDKIRKSFYHKHLKGKDNPMYGVHRFAKENPNWKNGKKYDSFGYILIYQPKHPYCVNKKYVREHRLVMEKHIKRYLKPEEVVHHINGIKDDNRIENLMLFVNESKHQFFHNKSSMDK